MTQQKQTNNENNNYKTAVKANHSYFGTVSV